MGGEEETEDDVYKLKDSRWESGTKPPCRVPTDGKQDAKL